MFYTLILTQAQQHAHNHAVWKSELLIEIYDMANWLFQSCGGFVQITANENEAMKYL